MTSYKVIGLALVGCVAVPCALAQKAPKKVVKTDTDMPTLSYPLTMMPSALLVADDATFMLSWRK